MDQDTRIKVKAYEAARDPMYNAACNGLIALASKRATQRVKKLGKTSEIRRGHKDTDYSHDFWSEFYHDEMGKLKREHGLLP